MAIRSLAQMEQDVVFKALRVKHRPTRQDPSLFSYAIIGKDRKWTEVLLITGSNLLAGASAFWFILWYTGHF